MACVVPHWLKALALLACSVFWIGCGGGGGGGGTGGPPSAQSTTFIGSVRQPENVAVLGGDAAIAVTSIVQVCVAGTSFCTEVDPTGAFTLDAAVGGNVVLVFDGPDFTARLALNGVPRGATVRIEEIVCSVLTGHCVAQDVDILAPLNDPPRCDAAVARPAVLWPPNHRMVAIRIDGVVDPDGDPIVIVAEDAAQDEPEDAPGSGNTAPDIQLSPLAVRAERSGQGDGRVYTIVFRADDGRGGSCEGVVQVCVPHDQGRGDTCA